MQNDHNQRVNKNKKLTIFFSIVILVSVFAINFYEKGTVPQIPIDLGNLTHRDETIKEGFLTTTHGYGVSAGHPTAVKVGMEILERGGTAADAAIAVSFALGVLDPFGSGIGGGGVMLIHPGENSEPVIFDYRETASLTGAYSSRGVGVPGFVKGMEEVHKEFGQLTWEELIEPSIHLANTGFEVRDVLSSRLRAAQYRLPVKQLPHFFPNGEAIRAGDTLVQEDLANSLAKIRDEGSLAFYEGDLAQAILSKVKGLTANDLVQYTPKREQPLVGEFNQYRVLAPPPPLAGVTVIQQLQMSELGRIEQHEIDSGRYIHLISDIARQTYSDNIRNIGDPDFVHVPIDQLLSREYAQKLLSNERTVAPAGQVDTIEHIADEENIDTTHFVIVDPNGMMVSATNTLSEFFGSGIYVDGFFLNNQLTNFSSDPQSPNSLEPGKRPKSYMSPIILESAGKPVIGIGSPGGNRIPLMISEVLIRHLKYNEDIQTAINQPRFFIQNNRIFLEKDIPTSIKNELRNQNYTVVVHNVPVHYGGVQALIVDYENNRMTGGSDPRREGDWEIREIQ